MTETFVSDGWIGAVERGSKACEVPMDDRLVHGPGSAARVPSQDRGGGQVQHDGDSRQVRGRGTGDECSSGGAFDARRIDHGQAPVRQAGLQFSVQPREGAPGRGLVRLVARDDRPVAVGRQDLPGVEMSGRERALPDTSRTDEHDEARIRDDDL